MQQEENHTLKTHNEELSSKLRRTEVRLSRVNEELARYRASCGRNPYVDFDEELSTKVKVSSVLCILFVSERCNSTHSLMLNNIRESATEN